ncbi:uncharacterized protein SCODWIG_00240 [Saccharomycodes ludwigii]|uniref:C2H2-type domain-containing protein n=1 Tax=Saccharomycodes ludwigii TaxID=36035 RepID=A0A376B1I5_9ASCO|nr:hypothetical protein SCDLUD_001769 [Saccharomycodes ludwigii]KAH3901981.1 hypothetical protein SCDLUD_001769 [Saccharomycodes ludwigii]SSD58479.1 uncharacterized protein SCODWIG_00240 [Saccharomycodes ludwigii]
MNNINNTLDFNSPPTKINGTTGTTVPLPADDYLEFFNPELNTFTNDEKIMAELEDLEILSIPSPGDIMSFTTNHINNTLNHSNLSSGLVDFLGQQQQQGPGIGGISNNIQEINSCSLKNFDDNGLTAGTKANEKVPNDNTTSQEHKRGLSGTAIFGFYNHDKTLNLSNKTQQELETVNTSKIYKYNSTQENMVANTSVSDTKLTKNPELCSSEFMKQQEDLKLALEQQKILNKKLEEQLRENQIKQESLQKALKKQQQIYSPQRKIPEEKLLDNLSASVQNSPIKQQLSSDGNVYITSNSPQGKYKFPPLSPVSNQQYNTSDDQVLGMGDYTGMVQNSHKPTVTNSLTNNLNMNEGGNDISPIKSEISYNYDTKEDEHAARTLKNKGTSITGSPMKSYGRVQHYYQRQQEEERREISNKRKNRKCASSCASTITAASSSAINNSNNNNHNTDSSSNNDGRIANRNTNCNNPQQTKSYQNRNILQSPLPIFNVSIENITKNNDSPDLGSVSRFAKRNVNDEPGKSVTTISCISSISPKPVMVPHDSKQQCQHQQQDFRPHSAANAVNNVVGLGLRYMQPREQLTKIASTPDTNVYKNIGDVPSSGNSNGLELINRLVLQPPSDMTPNTQRSSSLSTLSSTTTTITTASNNNETNDKNNKAKQYHLTAGPESRFNQAKTPSPILKSQEKFEGKQASLLVMLSPPKGTHYDLNSALSPQLSPSNSNSSSPRRCRKQTTLPPGTIDQYVYELPDKTFLCLYNNCGKHFARRYNIRSHIQTHLSDRPHKCDFPGCTKAFVRNHDLARHKKSHNDKIHVCPCGKSFNREDALLVHKARKICSATAVDNSEGNHKPNGSGGISDVNKMVTKSPRKRGRPRKRMTNGNGIYSTTGSINGNISIGASNSGGNSGNSPVKENIERDNHRITMKIEKDFLNKQKCAENNGEGVGNNNKDVVFNYLSELKPPVFN